MAHKYTDYDNLGGFPLALDDLLHDRNGVYETIAAFYANGGAAPMILSGGWGANTWLIINKEVIPYNAPSTVPPLTVGQAYYIVVSETKSPATFEDTSVKNVLACTKVADLVVAATVSPPSGGILQDDFVLWHKSFGENAKGGWVTVTGTGSLFDYNISYKKNELTNTLQLKGAVTVKDTVSLSNEYYSIVLLPIPFRPNTTAPFTAYYRHHLSSLKDSTSSDFITTLNAELRNTGFISMGLRRPDSSVTSYMATFNTIIPLD